jgi:AcrR family transcriptional regulator
MPQLVKRNPARRRRYDATGRRRKACQTHAAIVAAAERLFLRDGFHATTITAIAAAAGVSEESIYKTFRTKAGLVRAIRERGLAGSGTVHAEVLSDALQRERDPRRIIAGWGQLTIEVAPRVMPILQLVAAAAARDPELALLRDELDTARLARMQRNARALARGGHLRKGMRATDAADVLWTCSSPELYDLLVNRRAWPLARYAQFIVDMMIGALLPPVRAGGAHGGLRHPR